MASQEQTRETLVQNEVELGNEEGEEDQVAKLEAEVNEMAQKILHYRTTLADQLKSTLSSVLIARRPAVLPTHFDFGPESQPGPSNDPNPDVVRPTGSGNGALLAGDKPKNEKVELLKQKISNNATTMPIILKRMKDCMRRIDELDSYSRIAIHPAFKRVFPLYSEGSSY